MKYVFLVVLVISVVFNILQATEMFEETNNSALSLSNFFQGKDNTAEDYHSSILSGLEILVGVTGFIITVLAIFLTLQSEIKVREIKRISAETNSFSTQVKDDIKERIQELDRRTEEVQNYSTRTQEFASRLNTQPLTKIIQVLHESKLITPEQYRELDTELNEVALFHAVEAVRAKAAYAIFAEGTVQQLSSLYDAQRIETSEAIKETLNEAIRKITESRAA